MIRRSFRSSLVGGFLLALLVLPCVLFASSSSLDSADSYSQDPDYWGNERGYHYACVYVDSDPVGARVYGEDGSDWGLTNEKTWVIRKFRCKDPNETYRCADKKYTIKLKKSGYDTTYHTFSIDYRWSSTRSACEKGNRQEITVVLDEK
jgi:hypothetical protein